MASRDVIVAGAVLFMLAMGFFVLFNVFSTVTNKMIGTAAINQSEHAVQALQGSQKVLNRMDYLILSVFVALILGIIITAWFVGGNPIFMGIYFLVALIGVVMGTVFANTWETVTQSSIFGTTIQSFPIANNILLNLPIYLAVITFLGLIAMFAKPYLTGGADQYG